jgi:hypothetical protein
LLANLAPGLVDYSILTFGDEFEKHADAVEAEALFDERMAQKSDGYQPLPAGTACLLNNDFVLAHLCDDGYLSGTLHIACSLCCICIITIYCLF